MPVLLRHAYAFLGGAAAVLLVLRLLIEPRDWVQISTLVLVTATNALCWRFLRV